MKFLALGTVLLCAACSSAPEHRVDVTIRNRTQSTVKLRASAGLFSKSIVLKPGETWTGWWDNTLRLYVQSVLASSRARPGPAGGTAGSSGRTRRSTSRSRMKRGPTVAPPAPVEPRENPYGFTSWTDSTMTTL